MAAISQWQTRANALTALRLMAAPAFVIAVCAQSVVVALGCFTFAIATDFADGWVARRYGESSPLGGLVDHGVDATFVTFGTWAYASLGELPLPLPPLIAAAFLQYVFDSRAGLSRPLRASVLGRWNGIAYYVLVAIPTVRDALALVWPSSELIFALGWALVVTTLVSMLDRFVASRRVSSE